MKKVLVLFVLITTLFACGGIYNETIQPNPVYKRSSQEAHTWHKVCSRCHTIADANPRGYPAAQWPRVVDKMQNKKGGNQFTDKQKALILKYLIAGASN